MKHRIERFVQISAGADNVPASPETGKETFLIRLLRLRDSVLIVAGIVVGVGIFRIPSDVARELGDAGAILGVWVAGGLLAFLGSLVYSELASTWPRTGGPYVSLRECFGPLPSFLYGWGQLLVIRPCWLAIIALVFAQHLAAFTGIPVAAVRVIAVCSLLAASILNFVNGSLGAGVQKALTLLKVGALLALAAGAFLLPEGSGVREAAHLLPEEAWLAGWGSVGLALTLAFWAYDGWNEVTMIAGVIDDPYRTIHRAALIGCLLIMVLYLLVNVALVDVLTAEGVARSDHPVLETAAAVFGRWGGPVGVVLVAVVAYEAFNGTLLSGSRLISSMAVDGDFFSWARKVDLHYRTPAVPIVVQSLLAVPMVLLWDAGQTVLCYMSVALAFHVLAGMVPICMESRQEATLGRSRSPVHLLRSWFFLLAMAALLTSVCLFSGEEAAVGLGVLLAGVPAYHLWKRHRRRI